MLPLWTVEETETFRRALQGITDAGHDVAESVQAAKWYLARVPLLIGIGAETQDHEIRILPMDATRGRPGINVFYLVEGATVSLLSLRLAEPSQL